MYAENLEAAEEVIRRLFDPRRTYKKAYISPEIKLAVPEAMVLSYSVANSPGSTLVWPTTQNDTAGLLRRLSSFRPSFAQCR